jgi:Rv0078B-related antitoxin
MRSMEPIRDPEILARAEDMFDLCQTMENMMRQNLRRRYPEASEEEIQERFSAWAEKRDYVESSITQDGGRG